MLLPVACLRLVRVARFLRCAALVSSVSLVSSFAQSTLANPFGSLPADAWSATGDPDQNLSTTARIATVKNLGVPYLRAAFSHIDTNYDFANGTWQAGKDGAWNNYVTYVQSGCKLVLNFNWQGSANGGLGSVFPTGTDLDDYLLALGNVLDDMNGITGAAAKLPVVLVPENEEANIGYYAVSVNRENYLDQLAGAIPIAHNHGVKITNAGLTEVPFNLYVWNYYYNVIHDTTKADAFYNKALGPGFFTTYPTLKTANQDKLDIAKTLIDGTTGHPGYKDLALDYLNLHFYHAPGAVVADELDAFVEAVGVLAAITGKPVMSNEMGARITAYGESLPANTIADFMTCFHQTLMMPYVIWYSGPGPDSPYPVALSDPSGNLTTEGSEFRSYVTTQFDNVFTNTYWHSGSPSVELTLNSSPGTVVVGSGTQNFTTTIASGATQKWIYQWYKLGDVTAQRTTAATTATSDTFSTAASGTYYCFVTNPAGAVLTGDAMLWKRVKIGGDSAPNATYSSGTYTVYGKGGAIGSTSDVCQFVDQAAGAARVLIAKVSTASSSGKSGLMLRNGTSAGAPYVFIGLGNGSAETRFQTRATGGANSTATVASVTATWLKLENDGAGNITAYYSTSGSSNPPASWTQLGATTATSYGSPLLGLAVSGTSGAQTTSTFTNVSVN